MNTEISDNHKSTIHLLLQVNSLVQCHDKLAKESGENFNIYSIMNMESDEIKTHSSIIAELLNPKGSHELGSLPLEYFVEQLGISVGDDKMHYSSATSVTEEYVGLINQECKEGGRIDIVIKDKSDNVILIENKIYAPEQCNQLLRYKNAYPNASILFLTLDGRESETANGINYQCISYKKDILEWLDKCLNESVKFPMLNGTLRQYINLIKKLTGQTMNEKEKSEISKNIQNNLIAASEIANNFNEAHRSMAVHFITDVQHKLIIRLNTTAESWTTQIKCLHKDKVKVPYYLFQKSNWGDIYIYLRVETNNRVVKGITVDTKESSRIKDFKQNFEISGFLKSYKSSELSIVYCDKFAFNFSNPRETQAVYDSYETSTEQGIEHCTRFFNDCEIAIDIITNKGSN